MVSRHNNLSNPASEPSKAERIVTSTVTSIWIERIPLPKLREWVNSLPDDARVTYDGIVSGKIKLKAEWKEAS